MNRETLKSDKQHLALAAQLSFCAVAVLWLVFAVEAFTQTSFSALGLYPRSLRGLPGVLFSPLLHGSFQHLLSNTLAVFVLGTALLYVYPRSARIALPLIYIATGLLVWGFARQNVHIGASGVTYGVLFFLLVVGLIRRDRAAIGVSMMVFFLYGGSLIWGVVPGQPGISFESHLAGAVCGSILAVILRNKDPVKNQRRYDWENEDDDAPAPADFVAQLQQLDTPQSDNTSQGSTPDAKDPRKDEITVRF